MASLYGNPKDFKQKTFLIKHFSKFSVLKTRLFPAKTQNAAFILQ